MDECLDEFKTYELILVDTAGRSHKSEEPMEELDKLIETVEQRKDEFDFEIYLTLSVTTKYKDLVNIADKYKHILCLIHHDLPPNNNLASLCSLITSMSLGTFCPEVV